MKTLKEFLTEGILDIEDNIENLSVESLIEDFIKENYEIKHGNLQFKKKGDKYIVSTKGIVLVKNKNITALTNGVFEWGEVKSFYCVGCTSLQSLKGAPKKAGDFNCMRCTSLESLKGAPEKVRRDFNCVRCTSLKDLIGAPKEVGWSFSCRGCTSLESLKGAPEKVGRSFYCSECKSLKDLEGAPEKVDGDFSCEKCISLKSLEGAPKEVGWDFYCSDCGKKFTEEDVRSVCDVKGKITV